jgi:hypothetical protein
MSILQKMCLLSYDSDYKIGFGWEWTLTANIASTAVYSHNNSQYVVLFLLDLSDILVLQVPLPGFKLPPQIPFFAFCCHTWTLLHRLVAAHLWNTELSSTSFVVGMSFAWDMHFAVVASE